MTGHRCRPPGPFTQHRLKLKPGETWKCRCGRMWTLKDSPGGIVFGNEGSAQDDLTTAGRTKDGDCAC